MKYLLSALRGKPSGDDRWVVIDGDALHRWIDATRGYAEAMENLAEDEPYAVDEAVGVASISGYLAEQFAHLVEYDDDTPPR